MSRVSIELVPRSVESLEADLVRVRQRLPSVDTLNIPDLLRFDLRSWDACAIARGEFERAIPHVRAMDFAARSAPELIERDGRAWVENISYDTIERVPLFGQCDHTFAQTLALMLEPRVYSAAGTANFGDMVSRIGQ